MYSGGSPIQNKAALPSQVVAPPEEQGFGEQVAVAIRDWIVERLQDYHANLGTDTRLMEARPPSFGVSQLVVTLA